MESHTTINGFLIASSFAVGILGYFSVKLREIKPRIPIILTYLILLASTIYVAICAIAVSEIPCYYFKDFVLGSVEFITHTFSYDKFEEYQGHDKCPLMYLKVPATILISNYIFLFLIIAILEYRSYQENIKKEVQQN